MKSTKIKSKTYAEDVYQNIKEGKQKRRNFDNRGFCTKQNKIWVADPTTRYQIRGKLTNPDKIKKICTKYDEKRLQKKVMCYFSNDTYNFKNKLIARAGNYLIISGNNTSVVEVRMGKYESECHVVHFEKDLDGDLAELEILANMFNEPNTVTESCSEDDIRSMIKTVLERNEKKGLNNGRLTSDQAERISKIFSITKDTVYGYQMWQKDRKKAIIQYEDDQLADYVTNKYKEEAYSKGWHIFPVNQVSHANQVIGGTLLDFIVAQRKNPKVRKEDVITNFLVTYWFKEELNDIPARKSYIKQKLADYAEVLNITIEVGFLAYE